MSAPEVQRSCRKVSSTAMAPASGSERARWSNLVTTRLSPAAGPQSGSLPVSRSSVVTVPVDEKRRHGAPPPAGPADVTPEPPAGTEPVLHAPPSPHTGHQIPIAK